MKKCFLVPVLLVLISSLLLVFVSCAKSTSSSSPASSTPITTTTSKASTPTTQTSPSLTPKSGGVLRMNQAFTVTSFGWPPDAVVSGAVWVADPCVEELVVTGLSGNFQPTGLTTGFQVAPDGKSFTLTLRKGVKFQDGTDFNATAVKWNLNQIISSKAVAGASSWTSVDVIDDYTVRINTQQYKISDANTLSRFGGMMVSPTTAQQYGANWTRTNPVGTGPFKFVSYQPDQLIKYQRFDGYWGGKPYLDEIDFPLIVNATTAQMSFQAGDIDVFNPAGSVAADLMKSYPYSLSLTGGVYELCPDGTNPNSPFANEKVREAVEYAIDKQTIATAVGFGLWDGADQMFPKGTAAYDPNLKARSYDPQKAKALLTAAGYPNGFQTSIYAATGRLAQDALTAIQQNLKDVGINADLNVMPLAGWTDKDVKGWNNGLLVTLRTASAPFAASLQQFFLSTSGHFVSTQRPAGFDDLVNNALVTTDPAVATKDTLDAVDLWFNNAESIPLFISHSVQVYQKYVHDLGYYNTSRDWYPEKAWISK